MAVFASLLECMVCIFWRPLFWVLGSDYQVRIRRNINLFWFKEFILLVRSTFDGTRV